MKVTEHIEKAKGQTLLSLEILPPLKGQDMKDIITNLNPLMEYNPAFVDVTYHREETILEEVENGMFRKRTVRKRPSTIAISTAIQHKYNVDSVPHLLAGGFTKEETENALIEMDFLGINSVLALRGDAAPGEKYFTADKEGHAYADGIVSQIKDLNDGKYLDSNIVNPHSTNFCVGVAGYPEKHFESPNYKEDLEFLKAKVDAGADYIVTQMFFDNQKYFKFVEDCRAIGIEIPIIPGLKPLSTKRQLRLLPHMFSLDLPCDLVREVHKCKDNKAVRQLGVEWLTQQSKELKEAGVPSLHYYTMGKSDNIQKIVKELF
ncbi:MAG: methylenetetrahydrofolate reductase [NAD(P)H] [Ichthyobacteriaceae bacterium]|nr:methylenetetrahydrofolate reductase [NAD(P)H] [Ichthyobacteriaceae bacterium]